MGCGINKILVFKQEKISKSKTSCKGIPEFNSSQNFSAPVKREGFGVKSSHFTPHVSRFEEEYFLGTLSTTNLAES